MRCQPVARQALPRLALVRIGRVCGLEAAKKIPAGAVIPKGQADLQVGPLHPGWFVVDEAAHDSMAEAIGGLNAGDQELRDALVDIARQE